LSRRKVVGIATTRRASPAAPLGSRAIVKAAGTDVRKAAIASVSSSSVSPITATPWGPYCLWRSLRKGKLARQGAHHGAQTSSTTTRPAYEARDTGAPETSCIESAIASSAASSMQAD